MAVSQWTARKFDRKTSAQIADLNHVNQTVGRYNKALLPANELLKQIHQETSKVRKIYYENTLPWGMEGSRILPTANYMSFMSELKSHKSKWEQLVQQFCVEYPQAREDARQALGPLFDSKDYPREEEIRSKFHLDAVVFPVPSNDFRVQLADDELEQIQHDVEQRVKTASQTAMRDAWGRLYERVNHMATVLADPKKRLFDTLVTNTQDLCSLLPKLNFEDDPELEQMRQQVERQLAGLNPDMLRNDPELREQTADTAKDITSKMAVYMRGKE